MNRSVLPLALCALLTAAPARAEDPAPASPTTIVSQNLDMQSTDDESVFLFTGLVIVKGNNISLTCDRLEAVTSRSKKDIGLDQEKTALGQVGKFKSLLATGRVRIEQGDRVATCGRAEVLPGEERINLTEDPMVRDGESTVVGERIILLRGERRAIVEKARITLPPIKDLGFPKDAPAPATNAAPAPTSQTTPAGQTAPAVKFPAPTAKPTAPANNHAPATKKP
ncbi:MAG TPA: LptA/OstA family protein [Opitutaceae bacterium]|nr:LptA/OstA family protein [Opitutaceae bacterium]